MSKARSSNKAVDIVFGELLEKLAVVDSKQTNKALSYALGLSVTAVYERIKKLENNGVINRYVALVDKKGVIRSRKDSQGNPILYYRAIEENGFPNQINELKDDIKILLDEY